MYLHTIFGKNNTAIFLNAVISKVESGSHSAPKGAVTTGASYSEMISLCLDRYRSRSLIPISLTMAFIYRLGLIADIIFDRIEYHRYYYDDTQYRPILQNPPC